MYAAFPRSEYHGPSDFLHPVAASLLLHLSSATPSWGECRISHVHLPTLYYMPRSQTPGTPTVPSPEVCSDDGAASKTVDIAFRLEKDVGRPIYFHFGAQSLRPYGLRPAASLSTLDSCRYLPEPKTWYEVRGLHLPRRLFQPLVCQTPHGVLPGESDGHLASRLLFD